MSRSGDPPEGASGQTPEGGADDHGFVVFDEAFVRAARLREFSARERLAEGAGAGTGPGAPRSGAVPVGRLATRGRAGRQAVLLVLVIALAFGGAVWAGVRGPYRADSGPPAAGRPPSIALVPLAPAGTVAPVDAVQPYAGPPAASYLAGAAGVVLPAARATADFTPDEVRRALITAKDYVVASAIDPAALLGGDTRGVRALLAPDQLALFDRALRHPADDGLNAATGWLVRLAPDHYRLAAGPARVAGTMSVTETPDGRLEVVADHTVVYAVRAAAAATDAGVSLFTVRRRLRLRFDRDDLAEHHVELAQAEVAAGPLDCAPAPADYFRPLLAGQRAVAPAADDPGDRGRPVTSVCGVLATPGTPSARASAKAPAGSARTAAAREPTVPMPAPAAP
jgi:hypothetical protein